MNAAFAMGFLIGLCWGACAVGCVILWKRRER